MLRPPSHPPGHAVIARGHHDRAEVVLSAQMLRGGDDLRLGIHRHAGRGSEFLAVRHHDVGAGIAGEVAAARIDDQDAPGLARRLHQLGRNIRRQHALAVIGQHGDAGRRHRIHRIRTSRSAIWDGSGRSARGPPAAAAGRRRAGASSAWWCAPPCTSSQGSTFTGRRPDR